ncbi:MAG: glycosidase [Caulobacteraceae bacterium]|nr:glycosidase [Caulobacteraceae bacterium]
MSRQVDFNVEAIEAVHIDAVEPLNSRDLMSPYVWQEDDGRYRIMLRSVMRLGHEGATGEIWLGESRDGLHFAMQERPALSPGPGPLDIGGCEDPTVVKWGGQYIVYYTGVAQDRAHGQMLYAVGPAPDQLEKMGVALASSKTAGNTKEATITRTRKDRWRLFYEYAANDASLIGLALGEGVAGPWEEQPHPFGPRSDRWDSWHLSTGPLWTSKKDMPVMFYNGATKDARWRIGWAAFNSDCTALVDRCIEPLIIPPPPEERTGTDIAFAASVVDRPRGNCWLYYSLGDKALFRASIRRS